jgi:hypothetical protein
MSLYVYDGPTTTPPPQFGAGADAAAGTVSPTAPALVQTPMKHAAARFDEGSVNENTVIVVAQNTTPYLEKCSGPRASRYCSYPLFYHYYAFPHVKFKKPAHMAICHVRSGEEYGPLPGVDHDQFVMAHDKPANESDYTPGGYPVPGEDIEILPRNTGLPSTPPTVTCPGTKYPQVALFRVPRLPSGPVERAYAFAARTVNGAASAVGRALTPRSAYAIDNGVEHNTDLVSDFWLLDTTAHPDLGVTGSGVSAATVRTGSALTLTYTVSNHGTAPSPLVTTKILLQPSGDGSPTELTPSPALAWQGPLYPQGSRQQTAVVTIPEELSPGEYTISAVIGSAGGVAEKAAALSDNSQPVAVALRWPPPTLGVLIYGPTMSAPNPPDWAENEQTIAVAAGLTVTVADAATWATYTARQFAKYNAIVFGDRTCSSDLADLSAAEANKAVWSSVVTGPAIVIGTDPQFHQFQTDKQSRQLIANGIRYGASGTTTGLYATLSCYYVTAADGTAVSFLSGIGTFTVGGQGADANAVRIVDAAHPAMQGLTDAGLSDWGESIHAFFTGGLASFPASFHALATGTRLPDGVSYPYIVAR